MRLYISFPIARAGPKRFSPCWWRAIGDAPERYWGKSLFWKRRESPFALLCGCRQYERLLGKRFEFGARENYEKEFVQFFLPAASSSPAISRAPPATAGESGAVCVGVVIGFSVT